MIGARITEEQASKVSRAIEEGFYLTPSDLVKAAIDKEIKRLYPE